MSGSSNSFFRCSLSCSAHEGVRGTFSHDFLEKMSVFVPVTSNLLHGSQSWKEKKWAKGPGSVRAEA